MINLDERYHSYLHTDKCFTIDDECEYVIGYGFTCDGTVLLDTTFRQKSTSCSMILRKVPHKEGWQSG